MAGGWRAAYQATPTVPDRTTGGPLDACAQSWQGYVCTRRDRHERHMAGTGHFIVAAWPGEHQPTAAELADIDKEV